MPKLFLLSDLHYKGLASDFKKAEKLARKAQKTRPDAIILAGDIVDSLDDFEKGPEKLQNYLENFSKIAPTYLGFGNHDLSSWKKIKHHKYQVSNPEKFKKYIKFLETIPSLYPLHNKTVNSITGLTLPPEYYNIHRLTKHVKENPRILKETLKRLPQQGIVLLHSPALINPADIPAGVMIISGHMHSGALPNFLHKIPGGRGLISPERKWLPKNARNSKNQTARDTKPRALLILPAVTTFPGFLRPFNFLFPPKPVIIDL